LIPASAAKVSIARQQKKVMNVEERKTKNPYPFREPGMPDKPSLGEGQNT